MTLRQRFQPSYDLWRRTVAIAIIAALSFAMCATVALARPRTWADQDTGAARQPSWMPFSMPEQTPNPAVARITVVEGKNTLAQGSGTLVDVRGDRGLIVTNWHVVRGAKGPIVATFPDGFRSAATVLKVDKDWDLAALLIWRPNAAPIAISTTAPHPGDSLTVAGYGSGDYRAVTGRCTQYVAPGMHMPYEMVEVAAQARQGDSGGPILNERGELAGVLFGAGGGTTSGSFCGRVRWFLDSVWPADQLQDDETFVSVPAHEPATHWPADQFVDKPSDRLVEIPQGPMPRERTAIEPTPNYSIGSVLTPRTISSNRGDDSTITKTLNFNTLAGTTPIEQAKAILAAIGIVAVFMRLTGVARAGTKK